MNTRNLLAVGLLFCNCLIAQAIDVDIESHYTPDKEGGGIEKYVIAEIDKAKRVVSCQAYEFTSAGIGDAMVRARKRGVTVTIVLDATASKASYSQGPKLLAGGCKVFLDHQHKIAHNKIMLFDASTVLTGSFNYTDSAEHHNAENIVIVRRAVALHNAYFKQFLIHLQHSVPLAPLPTPNSTKRATPAPMPAELIPAPAGVPSNGR